MFHVEHAIRVASPLRVDGERMTSGARRPISEQTPKRTRASGTESSVSSVQYVTHQSLEFYRSWADTRCMTCNRYRFTNATTREVWEDLTATDLLWRFDVPAPVVAFLQAQPIGHKVAKGLVTVEVIR